MITQIQFDTNHLIINNKILERSDILQISVFQRHPIIDENTLVITSMGKTFFMLENKFFIGILKSHNFHKIISDDVIELASISTKRHGSQKGRFLIGRYFVIFQIN